MTLNAAALVLLASTATAGSWPDDTRSVPPSTAEKAADIKRLLELTGGARMGDQMLDRLFDIQRQAMPDVPAEVWNEAREAFEPRELLDSIAGIWNRHFTHEEILGLIAFYESPLGTHLRELQPQILEESLSAGQEWGRRALENLQEKLRQKGFSTPALGEEDRSRRPPRIS